MEILIVTLQYVDSVHGVCLNIPIIGLDSFSSTFGHIYYSLCVDYRVAKDAKLQYFPLAPCCQIYRVTEEALVAETAVWPIPFLINVYTALKGSLFYDYL